MIALRPLARREALAVAALYAKADVLLGAQATRSEVLKKMPLAEVIHFAGHAGARVVLAACDTAGAQPHDRSSGGTSLAGEFLRAGASSVVASLWKVEDSAGEGLFVDVHRGLAAGQSAPHAVARAQRMCKTNRACRIAAARGSA